jgi:hypothetical protein
MHIRHSLITALSATLFCSTTMAEPVLTHSYPEAEKLFFTEVKVDQALPYGGQRGHDVAVKMGDGSSGDSANLNWIDYDGNHNLKWFKHSFDWSLTRQGTDTTFTFGDVTVNTDSFSGDWDALGLYMNTSGWHGHFFDNAYIDFSLDTWNGDVLDSPLSYKSSLGQTKYFEFYDNDREWINGLSGSATLHWDVNDWTYYNKSPNGRLAFYLKGFDYTHEFTNPEIPIDETGNVGGTTDVTSPAVSIFALGSLLFFGGSLAVRRKKRV